MLEIHTPHGLANAWTGFPIHMATIVVGLLIAMGLEHAIAGTVLDFRNSISARDPLTQP